ncbi:amino acid adenylation domain-containing protein/non-ribosomal peptide synthase protein (TIGR01720 family) [Paenibacillus mucilaginosus]|uniref:amino acid adenylation domain-containing protein n=1 Tax=Paenibacillus mucilaginosus TaxID=61624 RepID=UPI003D23BDC0
MKAVIDKETTYWSGKWDGEDRVVCLPYTGAQGSRITSGPETLTYEEVLPESVTDRILGITGGSPLAVFLVLLAGMKGVLFRYTNETTLIAGVPTFPPADAAEPLLNPLLLIKSRLDQETSLKTLLGVLKTAVGEAAAHQQLPFWNYTGALELPQTQDGRTLIHTIISMDSLHGEESHSRIAADLSVRFRLDGGRTAVRIRYDGSRYDAKAISRLTGHLRQLLAVVLFQPELPLSRVEMLTDEERSELTGGFNRTAVPYERDSSIHGLFEEQVSRTPDAEALRWEEGALTYRELNAQANGIARTLLAHGLRPEQPVAIMAERSAAMVAGILGILKAGGAYVPVDPDYPEERIGFLLEDSGAKLLLAQNSVQPPAGFQGTVIPLSMEAGGAAEEGPVPAAVCEPGALAYILYTSGSTGRPKGVMVEHRSVVRLVRNTNYAELNEDTRILQTGAVVFDATTFEIWGALLNGGLLCFVPQEAILEAVKLKSAIRRFGINTMWLTAPLFNQLSQQEKGLFEGLHTLIVGGDVLSVPHINRALEEHPGLRLVNGYGPTENTTFSTTHAIEGIQEAAVPIGRPIANSTAYVVDPSMNLMPVGAWGELLVGGDGVARGYLNRPELTEDKFIRSPFVAGERCYRTGDLVRWRADGVLEYKGRIDSQVKIRGYRIETGEVESELLKLPGVRDAVVVPRKDEAGQYELAAYYVAEGTLTPRELRTSLAQELPAYMLPSYFVPLDVLPLTPNGKVDRRALPEPEALAADQADFEAPSTVMELRLEPLWRAVLSLKRPVGRRDHFFEIGGHSLRATKLVAQVHKELGINIQLKDIFKYPTLESMARQLETMESTGYASIERVEEQEDYPVSSAQKRIFFSSQQAGAELSYNMPNILVLEGPLDAGRLEDAFRRLIARHETLRTSFHTVDGEPRQAVHDEVDFAIDRLQAAGEEADTLVSGFVRPFDLSLAPLLRVGLVKSGPERHILLFDTHHIISDGASMDVFVEELASLYRGEDLPPLHIQYKDYAAWQQDRLQGDLYREQEHFWLDTFAGELPVLDLPTDYARPAVKSFRGSVYEFKLTERQNEGLRRLAQENGATLYMVLLTAYKTLLHRYSSQEDLVVGTPVAGRPHAELEPLIGMFVGTLPIRSYPEGAKTFLQYLQEIKEGTLQAFDHADYPFEDLVERLGLKRELSRSPLFDTMFALQTAGGAPGEDAEPEAGGLRFAPYPTEHTVAKFDLTLFAAEEPDGLGCSFEYAESLFNPVTIERMAAHFSRLVDAVVSDPEQPLAELELITEGEREHILGAFNATETAYPKERTLHELFEEHAAQRPDAPAVTFGDRQLTYGELNGQANRLARKLRAAGVTADRPVAMLAERSPEMVIGILAVLKAGGAYVPMDPEYPEERLRFIMEDSGARELLTLSGLLDRAPAAGRVILLDDEASYDADEANLEPVSGSEHLAYIMYTSGTTGRPKGNETTHRNIIRVVRDTNYITIGAEDTLLQLSSYAFDGSTFDIFGALLNGARLVLVPKTDLLEMTKLSKLIASERISVLFITTALFNVLVDLNLGSLSSLRKVLFGGERSSPAHVRRALQFLGPDRLLHVYGPTESTVFATCYPVHELDEGSSSLPIGSPIANTSVYIVQGGDPLRLAPIGVPGELCVGGDGLARGYLNRPELTVEKFIPNPYRTGERLYRTGDLARWLPDGNIEFLGRIDHQVKIRGHRIELGEVEAQILKAPSVQETIVLAREDAEGSRQLAAYYVADAPLSPGELRRFLARELPGYMIPAYFTRLEKMPLTPNGKIDRAALPVPSDQLDTGTPYEPPRTPAEEALARVWQSVLGAKQVGIRDSFFDLGGDSIKAIQVSSRLLQAGYKVEMKELFQYPTIAELGGRVRPAGRTADQGEASGPVELTPILRWFLGEANAEPHHFNQSVMLYRPDGFREEAVRLAAAQVVKHHDALRMIFERSEEEGYSARIRPSLEGELFTLHTVDLRESADPSAAVEQEAEAIQRSIDLGTGPLMKLGLFRCEDGDHLLLAIHHLVVDGVSWRILFEDFASAYEEALAGRAAALPLKTDSFQLWARSLADYAAGPRMAAERDYWLGLADAQCPSLPKDYTAEESSYVQDSESVSVTWTEEETELLLKQAHRAYNTEVNDLLLAALGLAVQRWTGQGKVLVNLEGHGREPIIPDMDITRTVGWFTSQFPVLLETGVDGDVGENIKQVKEGLRAIPNKGIGYGLLKFLAEPEDSPLAALKPEISFNYLGQFDQDLERSAIETSAYSSGMPLSGRTPRWYSLDINGMISGGQLGLTITYSRKEYRPETVQALADGLQISLREVIRHCAAQQRRELTPSDVTLRGMSAAELKELTSRTAHLGELEDVYPLTPMQAGMLFHSRYEPKSGAYFEQVTYNLYGTFDSEAFEKSLNGLISRHAVLRTNFLFGASDRPLQAVFRSRRAEYRYEDLRSLDEADREGHMAAVIAEDAARGFDLGSDLLLRIRVLRSSETAYRFIWSFHHIIMDGWCLSVVNGEVFERYSAELEGREAVLAPVTPYSDYIRWLQDQPKEEAASYWRQYLADYEQETKLPYGDTAAKGSGYTAAELTCELGRDLTNRINRTAKAHQVTFNTFMQTAWGIILQRYNNHGDAVFGSVVSGRPAHIPGVESMIGLFINTVPVRVRSEGKESVSALLRRTQEGALASQAYDYYPLYEIQSLAGGRQDLIHHIMVFENYPVEEQVEQLGGHPQAAFQISDVGMVEQTSYDFNLTVMPGEETAVKFEYNAELYSGREIERIQGHLVHMLAQMAEDPERSVESLELVTAGEREALLESFGALPEGAEETRPLLFHELFEQQARRSPEETAVIFQDRSLTYGELNARASLLAVRLRESGIGREQVVGILAERSVEMITAVLAVWKAGGAYLPLDPDYPAERIEYMLENSKAQVLLTQAALTGRVAPWSDQPGADRLVLSLDDESLYSVNPDGGSVEAASLPNINAPGDLAYVIYTSGTTGRPKGVMIEHRSLMSTAMANRREYRLGEFPVRLLQLASFSFDVFAGDLTRALLNGGTMVICPKEDRIDPERLHALIETHGLTLFEATPALVVPFLDYAARKDCALTSLKLVITSSDSCSVADYRQLQERWGSRIRIINSYGVTEAAIDSSYYDEPLEKLPKTGHVPVGRAYMNARFYILDPQLRPVPVGVTGELCIGGPGVGRGYMHRPDLTAEKFIENPFVPGERIYRTGDAARWMEDGNVDFIGRMDHQVKIRGYRIELGEIETAILRFPGVKQAVVIDRTDERGGKYLCGYAAAEAELDLEALLKELRQSLPAHMVPARLMQLERLPLTPNGKVDRKALPEPEGRTLTGAEYVAPRSENEKRLAGIWQEVLGVETVGIKDNFFDLGGHSLKVLELMRRIETDLGLELPLRTVFETPTLEALAVEIVKSELDPGSGTPATRLNASGPLRIFLFPPMIGSGLAFSELAVELDTHAVVYGLDYIDDAAGEEDMLDRYVRAITEIQQESPFILGGYSMGGNLAFEVTKEMEKRGYTVSHLLMIDSARIVRDYNLDAEELRRQVEASLEGVAEPFKEILTGRHRERVHAYAQYGNRLVNRWSVQSSIHNFIAAGGLVPGVSVKDDRLSWKQGTRGAYTEHMMKGGHDEILEHGYVEANAQVLKSVLVEIAGQLTSSSREGTTV